MSSRNVLFVLALAGCGGKPDSAATASAAPVAAKPAEVSPLTPSAPSTPTSGSAPTTPPPTIPARVSSAFVLPRGAGELPRDNNELGRRFLIVASDGSYRVGVWPADDTTLAAAAIVDKNVLRSALRAAGSARPTPITRDAPPSGGDLYGVYPDLRSLVIATREPQDPLMQGRAGENVLFLADAKAPALRVLDAVDKLPLNDDLVGIVPSAYVMVDSGHGGARSAFRLVQRVGRSDDSAVIDIHEDGVWLGVVEENIPLTVSGGVEARSFAVQYERFYGRHPGFAEPTVWLRPGAPMSLLVGVLDGLAAANIMTVILQPPP